MRNNNNNLNNINIPFFNTQQLQIDPVTKMKTEISEGHSHITQQLANLGISIDNIDTTVLLVGPTQVGKSTVVNYLAQNPLTVRWGDLGLFLEPAEIVNGIQNNLRVGQGMNATTTKPNCWYDPTTRTLYWDCPGFEDTREFPQDVINAFFVNKLFISSKNVKTILVFSENSFRNGAIPFRAVLNRISNMFEGREADLENSLSCVLTQQRDIRNNDRLAILFSDLEVTESSRRLLNFLIAHPEKISFFPYPANFNPPVDEGEEVPGTYRDRILTNIRDSSILVSPNPKISVSNESAVRIRDLRDSIVEDTIQFISTHIAPDIQKFCKNYFETPNRIAHNTHLANMRSFIRIIGQSLGNIDTSILQNFQNTMDALFVSCNINRESLSKPIDDISFFNKIDSRITFSQTLLSNWKNALEVTKNYINLLWTEPEITYNPNDESLQYKGFLIGTSDIERFLQGRAPKRIDLYSFNTLWIDDDITSHGTLTGNGRSYNFIAPNWKIAGNKTIDLRGLNGRSGIAGLNGNVPGAHGSNGTSGQNGGNGGNFYGKGNIFENLNQLVVNTSSGNGGYGGNGGNGSNGEGRRRTILFFGNEFTPGGNGGNGGAGGNGGLVGVGTIVGTNFQWNHISNPGINGLVGKGGLGGLCDDNQYRGANGQNGTNVNGQGTKVVQAILNLDLLVQTYNTLYNQQSIHNPFLGRW
jgi:hypothetical protein